MELAGKTFFFPWEVALESGLQANLSDGVIRFFSFLSFFGEETLLIVIIGYNPHVVQPATWLENKDSDGNVRRTLCLGATGNLLSDQYGKNDNGIIFQFTIQETEYGKFSITDPVYVPTYVWRNESEDGKYDYKSLAVGQWLEEAPEGMAYADAARMRQVWADLQSVMGSGIATVAAE